MGPQGTLYGQGSMGGTIRLITNQPDATEFSGSVQLSAADVDEGTENFSGDVMLNVPLIDDALAMRLVYSYSELGGFVDDPMDGREDINEADSEDIRFKLAYSGSDVFDLSYSYWKSEQNIDNDNSVSAGTDPADYIRFTGGVDNTWTAEFDLHRLNFNVEFEWGRLSNNTSYIDYSAPSEVNITALNLVGDAEFASEGFSNELQLSSNSNEMWNWVLGYFYRDAEGTIVFDFTLAGLDIGRDTAVTDSTTHSIFGEVSGTFIDGFLEVLVGLRYFEDERDFVNTVENPALPSPTDEETFDSTNPRFNVTLRPNDDSLYYFNMAKGYRSGIFNGTTNIVSAGIAGVNASVVQPDEIWTYELGAKWTLLDGAMVLESALYHSDWEDAQFQPYTPSGAGVVFNVGDAEITGVDLALVWATPLEGLLVNATFSYIDSEYTSVDPAVQLLGDLTPPPFGPFTSTIAEGEEVSAVPKTSYTISLDYTSKPFSNGMEWFANSSYSFRDEQNDMSGYPVRSDKQKMLSGRLGLQTERWNVALFGRNLTSETGILASSYGVFWGVARPREIGISAQYNF